MELFNVTRLYLSLVDLRLKSNQKIQIVCDVRSNSKNHTKEKVVELHPKNKALYEPALIIKVYNVALKELPNITIPGNHIVDSIQLILQLDGSYDVKVKLLNTEISKSL